MKMKRVGRQPPRFNPCFSGCRPAIILIVLILIVLFHVSILVLVDVALRFCTGKFGIFPFYVSILVLVDVALRYDLLGGAIRLKKIVSILVLVDVALR